MHSKQLSLLNASVLPIALAGLAPLFPASAASWYDVARLMQVWSYIWLAVTGARALAVLQFNRPGKMCLSLGAALAVASCINAPLSLMGLREVLLLCGLVLIAVNVAVQSPAHHEFIAKVIAGASAVYVASVFCVVAITLLNGEPLDNASLLFGYDNPRFLNHVQVLCMPMLTGIAVWQRFGLRWRLIAFASLTAHFALLLFSVGRSAVLALSVVAMAGLVFGSIGRRWSRCLAISAVIGACVYGLVFHLLPTVVGAPVNDSLHATSSLTSDHSRMYLWKIALSDVEASPLLGIGPMHFAHYPNRSGAHPHNFYLQVAAEFGLPFACIAFGLLGYGLLQRLQRLRRERHSVGVIELSATLACLAAAIDAMSSGNMVMPLSQLWIAIAAGLAMGGRTPDGRAVRPQPAPLWRWLHVMLVLTYMIFALDTTANFLARSQAAAANVLEGHSQMGQTLRPRFWIDGWF